MPPDLTSATLFALGIQTAAEHVPAPRVQLQFSQISPVETRLPAGVAPTALLEDVTGRIIVGGSLLGGTSGILPVLTGALEYIETIGSVLPLDENDERIVDALLAKRQENLAVRPLRRREGR